MREILPLQSGPSFGASHWQVPFPLNPSKHRPAPLHGKNAPPGHSSITNTMTIFSVSVERTFLLLKD
jgi:hypothetical protein